jgi:hypothetical protein
MSAITIEVPESLFGKLKEVTARDHSTLEQFALLALEGVCKLQVEVVSRHGNPTRNS